MGANYTHSTAVKFIHWKNSFENCKKIHIQHGPYEARNMNGFRYKGTVKFGPDLGIPLLGRNQVCQCIVLKDFQGAIPYLKHQDVYGTTRLIGTVITFFIEI